MTFITNRSKAQFYNGSRMTFYVKKDCVDIIFKIKKGVYLIVSVNFLSEDRLLLSCDWGMFWNRFKSMRNRKNVFLKLNKVCPLATVTLKNAFETVINEKSLPHLVYIDKEQTKGALALEMKAPVNTNSISDFIHESVLEKAVELMEYNLNLYCKLNEKCPFSAWKDDLAAFK